MPFTSTGAPSAAEFALVMSNGPQMREVLIGRSTQRKANLDTPPGTDGPRGQRTSDIPVWGDLTTLGHVTQDGQSLAPDRAGAVSSSMLKSGRTYHKRTRPGPGFRV